MITKVPPATGPLFGLTPVIAGAVALPYVNRSPAVVALVPPSPTTLTSTAPLPAGAPTLTADAPVKPVPVTSTVVPPVVGPAFGLTIVTAGASVALNVN